MQGGKRQGVPVRTIRGERLHDSRRASIVMAAADLAFLVFMFSMAPLGEWLAVFKGVIVVSILVGYLVWFFAVRLFWYTILGVDGLYIVRYGYAVRIPWEMVDHVETVVGYRNRSFIIHFENGLMDEQTQTPFALVLRREDRYPFSQRAMDIFNSHVTVTVNR